MDFRKQFLTRKRMYKINSTTARLFCLVALIFASCALRAQTFQEWFNQKATQLKYLAQQIAALEVYAADLQKGYNIAKKGLTDIGTIKNGEFQLHSTYFASLKNINPQVAKYPKISDIINLQTCIAQQCDKLTTTVKKSGYYSADEITYIGKVCDNLLQGCNNNTDAIIAVTSAGTLEMSDDERLSRIDQIDKDCKDKYLFIRHFANSTFQLAAARQKEQADIDNLHTYYNLPK